MEIEIGEQRRIRRKLPSPFNGGYRRLPLRFDQPAVIYEPPIFRSGVNVDAGFQTFQRALEEPIRRGLPGLCRLVSQQVRDMIPLHELRLRRRRPPSKIVDVDTHFLHAPQASFQSPEESRYQAALLQTQPFLSRIREGRKGVSRLLRGDIEYPKGGFGRVGQPSFEL